jgi:two-component system, sensor histidine kinase RegB
VRFRRTLTRRAGVVVTDPRPDRDLEVIRQPMMDMQRSRREWMAAPRVAAAEERRLPGVLALLTAVLAGSGERSVRLRTLILIRWIAVIGQAFTILLVHVSLELELPLVHLLAAVLLSAGINLALALTSHASTRLTERGAGLLLAYDILQLAFLLALTGGLQNPFSVLLLVPVTISATILSLRTTVALCVVVIGALTLLAVFPSELPWYGAGFALPGLYLIGAWVALVLATLLIAGYVWRIADEARRMSDALAATQMALAREQQLSALGGLAAAAAHELGSPLATIAVIARELSRAVPQDSPLAEDVAELVSQSRRCRDILHSLGRRPDEDEHAPFTRLPLSRLLELIAAPLQRPGVELQIAVEPEDGWDEPAVSPDPALKHGLANLIDNALSFAARQVRVTVVLAGPRVEVRIEDDGPGFPAEVLEELGEPYLSTRRESGGLGLGVFIAKTLLARSGATLQFDNARRGARATVAWDRARLEEWPQGERHERYCGAAG